MNRDLTRICTSLCKETTIRLFPHLPDITKLTLLECRTFAENWGYLGHLWLPTANSFQSWVVVGEIHNTLVSLQSFESNRPVVPWPGPKPTRDTDTPYHQSVGHEKCEKLYVRQIRNVYGEYLDSWRRTNWKQCFCHFLHFVNLKLFRVSPF